MIKNRDLSGRRYPIVPQRGRKCSVDGCTNWMVSNDLCNNHVMALRRYNNVSGKLAKRKVCPVCKETFESKRDDKEYCSPECYVRSEKGREVAYHGVDRWRKRNPVKGAHVNSLAKKTLRHFADKDQCVKCDETGERHHPDYTKPYEIVRLCRHHHKQCHTEGTHKDFGILQIQTSKSWKTAYLDQQDQCCHECDAALTGKELYIRGLGNKKKLFCSLECSEKDYFSVS